MIKEEILSMVLNLLPKEDKTGKFHPRFVEAVIEQVIGDMYVEIFKIKPDLLDKYTMRYGVPTPIPIVQESGTGLYYSLMPVNVYHIPDNASGVRHIYPFVETGNAFQPMNDKMADTIFNTDIAVVSSKIGYRVRQSNRVEYWNTSAAVRANGVRVDLLPVFSSYLDSDIVQIPQLTEKQGGTFIQRVLTVLQVVQPIDLVDDNKEAEEQTNKRQ